MRNVSKKSVRLLLAREIPNSEGGKYPLTRERIPQ